MPTWDQSDHPTPALPEELRGLTYDEAAPEQVAQVRKHLRAQLAAADARWTPDEREQRRAAFLDRLNPVPPGAPPAVR